MNALRLSTTGQDGMATVTVTGRSTSPPPTGCAPPRGADAREGERVAADPGGAGVDDRGRLVGVVALDGRTATRTDVSLIDRRAARVNGVVDVRDELPWDEDDS
ncbi:hypothetical protein [Nonomuraea sp. NPDC049141]|uniref:hypothetical protein n=1 Tax=Nonomuraea sp. NPDC049141 TaxID=3155500 RepID=UPI0033C01B74